MLLVHFVSTFIEMKNNKQFDFKKDLLKITNIINPAKAFKQIKFMY